VPPFSTLAVSNDSREAVDLVLLDRPVHLEAGGKSELKGLPPGKLPVHVRFVQSGRVMLASVELPPGTAQEYRLSEQGGTLVVENRLAEPIRLLMAGGEAAAIEPGASKTLSGLAPGTLVLAATTPSGLRFEHSFVLFPGTRETWAVQASGSHVLIRNLVGETIVLHMDGNRLLELAPLAAARFPVAAGRHRFSAYCPANRHEESFEQEIAGSELAELHFGPQGGRLLVENRSGTDLSVFRNGKPLGPIRDGTLIEFSAQPLGRNLIEALDGKGTLVLRREVEIGKVGDPRAELRIGETATRVLVHNRTGEGVKVDPAIRASVALIEPGSSAEVAVEGVDPVARFVGASTGIRYDQKVQGGGDGRAELTLLPVSGGIIVHNESDRELELLLDKVPKGTLGKGQALSLDQVAPGQHVLQGKMGDAVVEETSCSLVKGSWYVWRIGERLGSLRILNRSSEALGIYREGKPAGLLPQGTETMIGNLSSAPIRFAAVGADTGELHRFTAAPEPGTTLSWIVRSATGGVKLAGLAGRTLSFVVDGMEVGGIEEGTAAPHVLQMEPGLHVLEVVEEGRTVRYAVVHALPNLFSNLDLSGGEPEVEVRNRTLREVEVEADGLVVARVAAGESAVVLPGPPGLHTLRGRTVDGEREWLLREVFLREGGRFGWTLAE
jgi:hypothetical protein